MKKKRVQNCFDGDDKGECEMCHCDRFLTKHHLIPRAVHGKGKFQRLHSKQEMRDLGIQVCKLCHDGIHDIIPDERVLAEDFNTLESLMSDERIQRHVNWSRKQKC